MSGKHNRIAARDEEIKQEKSKLFFSFMVDARCANFGSSVVSRHCFVCVRVCVSSLLITATVIIPFLETTRLNRCAFSEQTDNNSRLKTSNSPFYKNVWALC